MAAVQLYVNRASSGGNGSTNATSGTNAAYASLNSLRTNFTPLATDDVTITCDLGGGTADTTSVNFNYGTAPASIRIEGNTTSGAGYYTGDDAINTAYYQLNSSTDTTSLTISNPNFTVSGIQFVHSSASGNFRGNINIQTTGAVTVENCSLRSSVRACITTGGSAIATDANWTFRNNLFVYTGSGVAAVDIQAASFRNPTWNFYHNTFYSNAAKPCISATGAGSNVATVNVKNNVCSNTTAPFSITIGGTISYDKNGTDAGTSGTTNEVTLGTLSSFFTSPGTTNGSQFTLKASSDGASGLGITTDKRGTARAATPDIGAYEFVSGGGGTDATVNLSGVSGSGSVGTLGLTSSLTLTGVSATGSVGTVVPQAVIAITGVSATGQVGTLAIDSSKIIAGVVGTGAAGTLTALSGAVVTITGVAGTGSAGTLKVSSSLTLTGVSATGQAGTLTVSIPASATVNLVGVSATGSVGTLIVSMGGVWTPVGGAGGSWNAVVSAPGTWTPITQAPGTWTVQ